MSIKKIFIIPLNTDMESEGISYIFENAIEYETLPMAEKEVL